MVKDAFKAEHFQGDFLELAAGTGTWSCLFLKETRTPTVVDGSVEMLSHNPVVAEPNVRTIIVDLFSCFYFLDIAFTKGETGWLLLHGFMLFEARRENVLCR